MWPVSEEEYRAERKFMGRLITVLIVGFAGFCVGFIVAPVAAGVVLVGLLVLGLLAILAGAIYDGWFSDTGGRQ